MKKLYKNKKEGKILGVCAGIAEYFDCDPTIVRLITVMLAFSTYSIGFWIYIIAAFVIPDKNDIYKYKEEIKNDMEAKNE